MVSLVCYKIDFLCRLMFGLRLNLSKIFRKYSNCNSLSKDTTLTYLLSISITHNKTQKIPLLNLLINCISTRSRTQILSIQDECTFRFINSLIIILCDYSANSWSEIVSLLSLIWVGLGVLPPSLLVFL